MWGFRKANEEHGEVKELGKFKREVKDARDLLSFAISEGVDVTNGTIQEINEAMKFLDAPEPLSVGHRVAFDKAYRDLVKILHPVTLKSLNATLWLSIRKSLLMLGVIFAVLLVAGKVSGIELANFRVILSFFILSICGTFFLWFLDLFTGVVTKARVIEIILFSYGFTFFALVGSISVFAILGWQGQARPTPNVPTKQVLTTHVSATKRLHFEKLALLMYQGPIGVVKGCSSVGANKDGIPLELQCKSGNNNDYSEWVINMGGTIVKTNSQGTNGQFWPSVKINGGVVVPLYVVILSLMGAAISMTRRVPEYQKGVYLKKGEKGCISREEAREYLVFQIMQFFTAPLLAITAYYLLTPDAREWSVVLGFASGFASETVLHAIRALVDKLKPLEVKEI